MPYDETVGQIPRPLQIAAGFVDFMEIRWRSAFACQVLDPPAIGVKHVEKVLAIGDALLDFMGQVHQPRQGSHAGIDGEQRSALAQVKKGLHQKIA